MPPYGYIYPLTVRCLCAYLILFVSTFVIISAGLTSVYISNAIAPCRKGMPSPLSVAQPAVEAALGIAAKFVDGELAAVNLKRADFHGHWNYAILPRRKKT